MTAAQSHGDRGQRDLEPDLAGPTVGDLDLDGLLAEVLDQAMAALDADTATVLLVDASGTELVARASRGLEEEVHQGVRIRIGEGFAGRIASQGRPAMIDRVDETTVVNPILWRRGLRTMVGVPLLSGDSTIGVLHVGSATRDAFTEADSSVLAIVADRVAAALQIRLLEAERDATEAVQRSLLPSVPRSVAGFDCAARHVPAGNGGIGGDWYDVFVLDTGEVWMVVGDVVGHGLRAATIMGRVRSAMRAFALVGEAPDGLLALTDRKLTHFEAGTLVTAHVVRSRPPYDEAEVAIAGHPPLVHAVPGRPAELVVAEPGPPLGLDCSPRPPSLRIETPPGCVLAAYTDGLVERRGELLDVGFERVRSAVTTGSPDEVCDRVMASAIGRRVPEDDAALIVMQRRRDLPA